MFTYLETVLISLSESISLQWFVFIASIIEEIIAPIPSPTVMLVAGSLASLQSYGMHGLFVLVCIGAAGKTVGAGMVYGIVCIAEDVVLHRFGKFFGVTREEIAHFGTKIGSGFRGYMSLTLFRAVPIVPSVLVSVGSGVLRIPLRMFLVSAFLGTIIRDGFYLYVGYVGTDSLHALVNTSSSVESIVEYGVVLVVLVGVGYVVYKRRNRRTT